MEDTDYTTIPPELAAKERRIRTGIYCFVSCLGMSLLSLAAGGAFEIIGGPVFSVIGEYLFNLSGICFAGIFLSFGILISGALKAPREADVRPWMSTTLSGVTLIFSACAAAFTLIVLGIFAWIILSLYATTGNLILIAITYFLFSAGFFAFSVLFIISRNILKYNQLPGPLRNIMTQMRSSEKESSRGTGESENTQKVKILLSRVDKFLGTVIGIVLGLLMEGADSIGLTGTIFGLETTGRTGSLLTPERFILTGASVFIFIFGTMLILRAIRGAIASRSGGSSDSRPDIESGST